MIFSALAIICVSKLLTTGGSKGVLEAADKRVVVKKFSNATLKCSGMSGQYCFIEPVLTWHYRNKSIIKSNDKYTVRERKRKCPSSYEKEVDFFLEISNVTEADSGVYRCQMKCHLRNLSDSIQVTSYFEPGLGKMFSKLFQ